MSLTEAQELFSLFFAIYFGLIIDRSHEMYKSWDTYNAKGKSHNIKRLLAAWIILFIVPLLHFAILFILLGSIDRVRELLINSEKTSTAHAFEKNAWRFL